MPVRITVSSDGPLQIADEGIFIVQHTILSAEDAPEPEIIITDPNAIRPSADRLVIVTHGWLDKGQDRWPADLAAALYKRIDPNEFGLRLVRLAGRFGRRQFHPSLAATVRDIAGPRLAAAIIKLDRPFRHIHLIGHSAGAWAIQTAACRLARAYPEAAFHLTFLDAYVPNRWDPAELGLIFDDPALQAQRCWADHYYTRDITLHVTENDLKWRTT